MKIKIIKEHNKYNLVTPTANTWLNKEELINLQQQIEKLLTSKH